MKTFYKEIEDANIGKIEKEVFLSKYTTYKVGGLATCIIYPKNIDKLLLLMKIIKKYKLEYKILGNGSNLLFSDRRYENILIKLTDFSEVEFIDNKITVGAGYPIMKLAREAMKKSLTGLEFAAGIPGTIGGAIYMNAGAYNTDMGYIVSSVKVLTPDLKVIELVNTELDFHYRSSFFQKHPGYIVLEANIRLKHGKKSAIEDVMKERKNRRISTQPLEYPSAGSVFRNPSADMPAGKIIEELGLKGLKKGGAQVSNKHANFIINKSSASSDDIKYLIDFIKKTVKERYNINLKVEQEFVNWE